MNATEVIERYIEDTVWFLPRSQRDDVAAELRSLLEEELHARASESGRPPDEALALSLVRGFGRPNEVAARYQPVWTIIDPADSRSFLRAAVIGAGALLVLGGSARLVPSLSARAPDLVKIGILSWLGVLVLFFGAKSWIRWRWPASGAWKPRDHDRVSRVGTAILVLVAAPVIALYAAPGWVLDRISGGRIETSWATYTADFQRLRLHLVIGLMIGLLVLRSIAAVGGRWSRLTRRIDIALNLALAVMVLGLAVRGGLFRSDVVDQIARNVLALVALIYVPGVAALIFQEIGRVHRPSNTPDTSTLLKKPQKPGGVPDGLLEP